MSPRPGASRLAAIASAAALLGLGCSGLGRGGPAEATRENRISLAAGLLEVEDRRDFDPLLVGRASSAKDPWVRGRAALACGRLRDVEASIYLPVLLADPVPAVRRAAAFASGISGDRRLVPGLARALADPDGETAAAAAVALGRLGGAEASEALRAALARQGGPRGAAARALYASPDAALVPLLADALTAESPGERRDVAWALARSPRPGSAESLRPLLDDADPEIVAWAARALGLLSDAESVPRLVGLARGADAGPAIQALFALERLAAAGHGGPGPREAGLARHLDEQPGVALAALTLLRRFATDVDVAEALARVVTAGGRRGGAALASLAAGDPGRAYALAFPEGKGAGLDLRLGAAEALALLPADRLAKWWDALLADALPRVRMEAVSRFPRESLPAHAARLARALGDPDGSVKAAALDAAGPLASGPGADPAVRSAFASAFASALASGEPDLSGSALDAAAALAEGGCLLLAGQRDAADDLVRARARRLLADRCGEDVSRLAHRPFATRLGTAEYKRLAQRAETGRVVATVETTRGTFEVELLAEEAPMTVESFAALALKGFFDGTTIHRVVPDFVVQAGDPRGDGTGGPGYALRDELNPLPYVRGRVGMALAGPDTGGSQWFVTLSRQPHLDGAYTVFGEVRAGLEVVDRIEQNDRLLSVKVREESRPAPPGLASAGP